MASESVNGVYRDFLSKVSKDFCGARCHWLRFLLHDYLTISQLSSEHESGIHLFNSLDLQGYISPNNVELLLQIAELTKHKAAITKIKAYRAEVRTYNYQEYVTLTPYRTALYEALRELTNNDFQELIGYYNLGHHEFSSVWSLVFYLETETLLDDSKEKVERFANRINETGKRKLLACLKTENRVDSKLIVTSSKASMASTASPSPIETTRTPEATATAPPAAGAETPPLAKLTVVNPQPTANTSRPTTANLELTTEQLVQLLVDVSKWWKKYGNINLLRLLLRDFEKITKADIENEDDPYELFGLLRRPGLISQYNIDVLIEAVELCGLQGVEPIIKKNVSSFQGFGNIVIRKFTKFRQHLIKFGCNISVRETKTIGQLCDLDTRKLVDQWALIIELEKEGILTTKNRHSFIERLRRNEMKQEADDLSYID